MKATMIESIKELSKKAKASDDSTDAQRYSQAALNLAHALELSQRKDAD